MRYRDRTDSYWKLISLQVGGSIIAFGSGIYLLHATTSSLGGLPIPSIGGTIGSSLVLMNYSTSLETVYDRTPGVVLGVLLALPITPLFTTVFYIGHVLRLGSGMLLTLLLGETVLLTRRNSPHTTR